MAQAADGQPPCRVCGGFNEAFSRVLKDKKATSPSPGTKADFSEKKNTAPGTSATPEQTPVPEPYRGCPEDTETLGRATWSFLHTMAAYFPETPSAQQQDKMKSFMATFAEFYPCRMCGEHLTKYMRKSPVDARSNAELSLWMCNMHNEVNERLGKQVFDCSKVLERWLTGWKDNSCD
eukprot:m.52242 g.52242  ORF g.52242 m.52242 type:complete len:178 (-) comp15310_c0_seq3:118-651(-)